MLREEIWTPHDEAITSSSQRPQIASPSLPATHLRQLRRPSPTFGAKGSSLKIHHSRANVQFWKCELTHPPIRRLSRKYLRFTRSLTDRSLYGNAKIGRTDKEGAANSRNVKRCINRGWQIKVTVPFRYGNVREMEVQFCTNINELSEIISYHTLKLYVSFHAWERTKGSIFENLATLGESAGICWINVWQQALSRQRAPSLNPYRF